MEQLPGDSPLPYRADIDGLRAIAVIAVILFHAGVPGLSGGYVGVDVFFVISGYLITGWLMTRESRRVPQLLREFYTRRGRRILPAFVLVLGVTTPAAAWLLQPAHLEIFGQFLATAAVMLANFGARLNGNYFGWNAGDMPLLHLWSIAVEEQFYLFYPLLFVAITRHLAPWRGTALALAAGASFVLCLWAARTHPVANYLFLPTRAWELLLGGLVAVGAWPRLARRWTREMTAGIALLVIIVACCRYETGIPYPGILTLAPAAATALLIAAGADGGTAVTRALSWRPLVFTGLISYSLYLWHLPVLGLFHYYNIFAPRPLTSAALCIAIYLLSAATWAWIERPFRGRVWLPRETHFWSVAAVASAALLATGLMLMLTNSLPRRLAAAAEQSPGIDVRLRQRVARCMVKDLEQIRRGDLCRLGPASGAVARVVVWGDSHTWALTPVYQRLADEQRLQIFVAQYPRCNPLVGAMQVPKCASFNAAMVGAVRAIDPQLVVLGARWNNPSAQYAAGPELTIQGDASLFSRGLRETLQRVGAPRREVCVVKSVPTLGYSGEYALTMARRRGIASDFLALTRVAAYAEDRAHEADIDALERRGLLHSVDPKSVLCREPRCRYQTDAGASIYMDDNHVSIVGANLLHDEIARCFAGVVARRLSSTQ